MFLRFTSLRDAVGRAHKNEDGAALLAVLGFMTVSMLLVTLLSASVVTSISRSTSVRADVQSQAAAEAGISDARALVDKSAALNTCTTSTVNSPAGSDPRYTVTISWTTRTLTAWTSTGCVPKEATKVRYMATGYAASVGVTGQSSGDVAYLETVFGAAVPAATSTIAASGVAVYSYGSVNASSPTGFDGFIGSFTGANSAVQVYNGSSSCTGTITVGSLPLTSIKADIYLRNGSYSVSACTVNGSVSASGGVTLSGDSILQTSTITGAVKAKTLTASGYSTVGNGVYVESTPTLTSVPGISLIGIPLGTKSPTLSSPGYVRTTTVVPAVPDWTEFNYQGAAGWPGYDVATLTASQCNADGIRLALTGLGASKPLVIDAQACTSGMDAITVSLTRDVALIVPNTVAFTLPAISLSLGSGKLRIIQPDADVTDGKPTCPTGASLSSGAIDLSSMSTLIYTPCTYNEQSLIGATTGQIYAGRASFSTGLLRSRTFAAVGLPGVDLGTGQSTATGPRQLLSSRNIATGP